MRFQVASTVRSAALRRHLIACGEPLSFSYTFPAPIARPNEPVCRRVLLRNRKHGVLSGAGIKPRRFDLAGSDIDNQLSELIGIAGAFWAHDRWTREFQGVKDEVDLFQVDLTAARHPSARIYRRHFGLACQIPVGSASRDHPVRRRSKGQMAT
jgi:hypothetical protein